jgi:hypothetical protein
MKAFEMPAQAQIDKWKKEHGALHKITVKVTGQPDAICIVRDPKVSDIQQSSALGGNDEYLIGKIQLENCWLAGDERIKTRLSVSQAAAKKMAAIFPVFPFQVDTVFLDSELTQEFTKLGVDQEKIQELVSTGLVRKVTILNGRYAIMDAGIDKREVITAYFKEPDLAVQEIVDLVSDFLDKGKLYIQECFITGDERFKSHTSEPIAFAAYLAGNALMETFTSEVEKL